MPYLAAATGVTDWERATTSKVEAEDSRMGRLAYAATSFRATVSRVFSPPPGKPPLPLPPARPPRRKTRAGTPEPEFTNPH